jgi:hypothetical protein
MHLLMLWHSMASAELISAKPLLALVGVVIGVAGPFDHPGSWEQPGMHLLMFWHNMLTPMAPMGTGRDAYCARTSVTHSATHLLRVSPIFECENSIPFTANVYNSTHWRIHVHSSGVRSSSVSSVTRIQVLTNPSLTHALAHGIGPHGVLVTSLRKKTMAVGT